MTELVELKNLLSDISKELDDLSNSINITSLKEILKEKEILMNDENFWNDSDNANNVLKDVKSLKSKISSFSSLDEKKEDISVMIEMLSEEFIESEAESTLKELNSLKMMYVGLH